MMADPTEASDRAPLTPKPDILPDYGANVEEKLSVPEGPRLVSTSEALVLFLKSMVGVGWMSMAKAFNKSGIMLGIFMALGIGFITIWGLNAVVAIYIAEVYGDQNQGQNQEQVEGVPDKGSTELRMRTTLQKLVGIKLGPRGDTVATIAMLVVQLGVGVAFMVYFGQYGSSLWDVADWIGTLAMAPLCILLCQIRTLDKLTQWASVGMLLVVFVIVFVLGYCANRIDGHDHHVQTHGYANGWEFPMFFGITFFSMEGIFCLIPIVQVMQTPTDAPRVVMGAVSMSGLMYVLVGLIGYLSYGEHVKAPITKNLPDDVLCMSFRGMQCVSLLFTLPVQMYPVAALCDTKWPKHPSLIRLAIVLLITGLAMAIPNMADVLSVVGGLGMTTAGILLPVMMWVVHTGGWDPLEPKNKLLYSSLMVLIVILGLWATTLSVIDLVD